MAASKTQKSNTRKKSTAKGNVSGKKKTAGRPSTRKNVNTKQSISSGFQTEIVILVLIAASIILMVSCLCGWKHQQGTDGSDGADGLCISIRFVWGVRVSDFQ